MWFLTNLQLKLIYRYYIEEPIGSDSGHSYKGVTKTRRQYRRHVKPQRSWSCSYLPIMDGGLVIGLVLNKRLHRTFGLALSPFAYFCHCDRRRKSCKLCNKWLQPLFYPLLRSRPGTLSHYLKKIFNCPYVSLFYFYRISLSLVHFLRERQDTFLSCLINVLHLDENKASCFF